MQPLVGAIVLGPRIGKYDKNGKPRAIPGHNLTMAALGVFILWFCWFGFNGGSTVAMEGTTVAAGGVGEITMGLLQVRFSQQQTFVQQLLQSLL